jgi:hypothetical protein
LKNLHHHALRRVVHRAEQNPLQRPVHMSHPQQSQMKPNHQQQCARPQALQRQRLRAKYSGHAGLWVINTQTFFINMPPQAQKPLILGIF